MGKSKNDSLSHEEIWDDSALVRSWDEAVEEYQLYHSIHAKGENVDDVLREAEDAGITKDVDMNEDETMEGTEGAAPTVEAEAEAQHEPQETQDQPIGPQKPQATDIKPTPASAPIPAAPACPTMPMPEAVMANVQDENLKRLMMSWYFAGYYTGLYEGQQQAGQGRADCFARIHGWGCLSWTIISLICILANRLADIIYPRINKELQNYDSERTFAKR